MVIFIKLSGFVNSIEIAAFPTDVLLPNLHESIKIISYDNNPINEPFMWIKSNDVLKLFNSLIIFAFTVSNFNPSKVELVIYKVLDTIIIVGSFSPYDRETFIIIYNILFTILSFIQKVIWKETIIHIYSAFWSKNFKNFSFIWFFHIDNFWLKIDVVDKLKIL